MNFSFKTIIAKLLALVAMLISIVQISFVAFASYAPEGLPVSTLILSWTLKVILSIIGITALISLFATHKAVLATLSLFSYIMVVVHGVTLAWLKILPSSENGLINYTFLLSYVVIGVFFHTYTKKLD
jgi:hypothetical protein